MDERRPAAACRLAQDADPIARPVGRVAAQRVLPHQAVVEDQVDVGARLPGRQVAAVAGRPGSA